MRHHCYDGGHLSQPKMNRHGPTLVARNAPGTTDGDTAGRVSSRKTRRRRSRRGVKSVLLAEKNTEWHLAMTWRRDAYLSHAAQAWLALAREDADA
jgi:hypothetical protein